MTTASKTETLHSAMASAFGELEAATKSANNPHFKSKYADIGAVIDAIKPALIKHGLFFTQHPQPSEEGVTVETFLHHASGESLSLGSLYVPANKRDAQGFGSALTYARRYALVTAFGVPTEDDDGNAARNGGGQSNDARSAAPDPYTFPPGPAKGITEMKAMARALWREIEGCGDQSELNPLLDIPENKALLKQMSLLENPAHREIWEGDGKDNPGIAGLITRKETEFAMHMAALART